MSLFVVLCCTKSHYFNAIGTGIICASPNEKDKDPYLLTAKHVFDSPLKNWHPKLIRIRFSWFNKYSVTENCGIELKIRDDQGNPLWIEHENKQIDLALIKLQISQKQAQRDNMSPMRILDIAKEDEIFEGAPILIFGYPGAVGPNYWTHALVRSDIISWISSEESSYVPFLVDAMVFPGNSGGPVFRVPSGMNKTGTFVIGGRAAFVGIVSAVKRQPIKLESMTDIMISGKEEKSLESFDYMGLAVVVPAEKVKELLNQLIEIKE